MLSKFSTRGFTLIELLVVIAIIGILASIVLVSLNSARGKGRDTKRISEMQEMLKAISMADLDSNVPVTLTGVNCANNQFANGCDLLANYNDSSGTLKCSKVAPRICQYTMFLPSGSQLTTENFEICTYLETGGNVAGVPTTGGNANINSTSLAITAGCP